VDLTDGLRIPPFEPAGYSMTSPSIVVNGVVITGSSIGDNSRPAPASGEVRGFDARTGQLKWTWDPIPQDPADPVYNEWQGELGHKSGAANAWTGLAADAERDLVFVPTGSAAPDYYGVLRLGDNRYANSIVALRASTGRVVWAFQTVHHDLWDYDNASPPALATIMRGGTRVPVVVQANKTGMLYVLDRETGRPQRTVGIDERVVRVVPGRVRADRAVGHDRRGAGVHRHSPGERDRRAGHRPDDRRVAAHRALDDDVGLSRALKIGIRGADDLSGDRVSDLYLPVGPVVRGTSLRERARRLIETSRSHCVRGWCGRRREEQCRKHHSRRDQPRNSARTSLFGPSKAALPQSAAVPPHAAVPPKPRLLDQIDRKPTIAAPAAVSP
jgi:hypothetical protein